MLVEEDPPHAVMVITIAAVNNVAMTFFFICKTLLNVLLQFAGAVPPLDSALRLKRLACRPDLPGNGHPFRSRTEYHASGKNTGITSCWTESITAR
ncbi:MAG TPA: hypothetical protein DEP61_08710 [Lachnospiraceae bacterium]|nr:hypothetical protein [Lachnospiraceae bacterium]